MTRRWMLVIALLAGCGGKKDEAPAATGSAKAPPAAAEDTAPVLIGKPTKPITGKAGGVEYTIDLPEDALPARAGADSATFAFKESVLQLSITATAAPMAADELAKKRTLTDPKAEDLVRADQASGDSYIVSKVRKDKTWFLFERCRNIPYGNVCCAATMRSEKPIVALEQVLSWATQICEHASVSGEPHSPPVSMDQSRRMR